ncbi:MAG: hypothetical protein U0234_12870 [Sandaracinus sp.]
MRVFFLGSLLLIALPSPAHAWVDATVRSASARVAIDEHAHAHVSIDATLRIDGGWLEALEIDGLDPGLTLDASDPVTMQTQPTPDELAAGEVAEPLEPTVTLREDGVLVLSFPRRRTSPRRGEYLVHLAYDASLAERAVGADDGAHVHWTFPAWRSGLDSVVVELTLPPGAAPLVAEEDEIASAHASVDGREVWTLTRAHLARTREWPIEILVPEGVLDAGLAVRAPAPAPRTLASSEASAARAPWQGGIALAIASLVVALRALRRRARERDDRVDEHPLVPLPDPARALLALAVGAGLLGVALVGRGVLTVAPLALALAALGVSRAAPSVTAPKLGSFRHATPSIRIAARKARWRRALGLDAWLDATTLPGNAVLGLALAAALRAPAPAAGEVAIALAVGLVAMLDAPRARRAEPPLLALTRLVSFASRARVVLDETTPVALMPVVHLDVRGAPQDARLRVIAPLPEGVLRADVVVRERAVTGARFGLLVVTARGSAVDAALELDPSFERIATGAERHARLCAVEATRLGEWIAKLTRPTEAAASADARSAA